MLLDRGSRDRALFDRIAHAYAKKDLYEPCRVARRARLQRTIALTGQGPDADMLEVGCGAGFAAEYLEGRFGAYTGIDYSEELIAYASQRHAAPNITFHAVDLYEWRCDSAFDVIFAIGVLHHMPDIPRAMSLMCAMLKPGGHLVVNEPQPANVVFHGLRKLRAMVDSAYSSEQEELEASRLVEYFERAGLDDINTSAQGLLSTPFAEVPLSPHALSHPMSRLACRIDAWLEDYFRNALKGVAWNVIVAGCRAA